MIPPLTTTVQVEPFPFKLGFEDTIVTFGSCFSDEIGGRMKNGGFKTDINPFGTLYNPASIADALERVIDLKELCTNDLVEHEGLWHSWHHHGSFSRQTAEECLKVCNNRLRSAHEALDKARLLMITFGTAWVFKVKGESLKVKGEAMVVANCHKLPPKMFTRQIMDVEEIVTLWQGLTDKLFAFNPRLTILFTVSPIRHMADGAHGNQLSKSTLQLAVDKIIKGHGTGSGINYFPAYEIVMDELRDYRFYGPDMTHPTPLAVDIVYDRFQQACMTPATIQQAHNNTKHAKRTEHIPLRECVNV